MVGAWDSDPSLEALMATSEQKIRLAHLLREVASGAVSSRKALEIVSQWRDVTWTEPLLSNAYHQLTHFDADEDIRSVNRKYADKQTDLLLDWANRLEVG